MRRLIATIVLALASATANAGEFDVCEITESGFVDTIGKMAIGSTITAYVSGEVVLLTLTSSGWVAAAAIPAVPSIVAGSAMGASAVYLGLHGACAYNDVRAKASEFIEDTTDLPSPREVATDWICELKGDCPEYDQFN